MVLIRCGHLVFINRQVIKFLNMSNIACNMLCNHEYLLNWKFVQFLPSSLQSVRMASVQDTAALMACFASAASFFLGHKSPFRREMGGTWWNEYHYIDSQTSKCATRISCFLFRPFSYDSVHVLPVSSTCYSFSMHIRRHVLPFCILPPTFSSCHWRIVG